MHKPLFFALPILAGTMLAAAVALAGSHDANASGGDAGSSKCPPSNWTTLDLDGDGYATKGEVTKAAPCLDFDTIDANADGSISRVEFLNFQEAKTKEPSQKGEANDVGGNPDQSSNETAGDECIPDKWTALDLDHDGYATKTEVKKAAPCIDFNTVDTNSDGSISRVEFLNLQEAKAKGTSLGKAQGAGEPNASPKQDHASKKQQSAQKQAATSGKKIDQSQYDTPDALIKNVPKGKLTNPFDPQNEAVVKAGHQAFMAHGCSGCHGGGGGGGMGPPLTDGIWSYGDKPDTLYRLVTLGSKELQAKYGYSRNTMQTIQGDMPGLGGVFDNTDDIWKIITWIESKHLKN